MVVQKIREWLIFFRAHTGMLEAPIPAFGAALALGSLWKVEVAIWAIIGLLYHYAGYGQNSYYDWFKGYDKDDPHKQHHPLNTGSISGGHAKLAANYMVLLTVIIIVIMVGLNLVPMLLLALGLLSGVSYNLYGKSVRHKYILLAVAHSMLFLIPYTSYNGDNPVFAILVFTALVVHHCFQIAISGDIKDIDQDESSLLKWLGIKWSNGAELDISSDESIENGVIQHCRDVEITVTVLTALQASLAIVALFTLIPDVRDRLTTLFIIAAASLSLWLISIRVVTDGPYIRKRRMRNIATRELIGFWMIYMAFIPLIGGIAYGVAFLLSILYLTITSKFMWGTLLRPKV